MSNMEIWKLAVSAAAVIVSLIGVAWGIRKDFHLRTSRLREDFKFALDLKAEIQPLQLEGLIKERGLHALVGTSRIPTPVVEYLISLRDPQRALHLYKSARKRVVFLSRASRARIVYKGIYRHARIRLIFKSLCWLGYASFYFLATSPLLFNIFKMLNGREALHLGLFTFTMFFPISVWILRYGVSIRSAESLLDLQTIKNSLRI